jgi:hypothetical protein
MGRNGRRARIRAAQLIDSQGIEAFKGMPVLPTNAMVLSSDTVGQPWGYALHLTRPNRHDLVGRWCTDLLSR